MNLGRDAVLMVPYKCCYLSARSTQRRIQGGAKIGYGGPLLQETSSSDWKATATNRMHSNDLEACGKKCCYRYFWFHSESNFLCVFDVFVDLVIFAYFNAISIQFLCGKLLYLHLFCEISMFLSGRRIIEKIKCLEIFNEFFMFLFRWRKRGGGVRLGYCFTPYQRLWQYNGAPLVAFYDTLGIRRMYSRLKPPAPSRGKRGGCTNACICIGTHSPPLLQNRLMDV